MAASFFRGTQIDQNVKFKDKEKELIKKMKWPSDFDLTVDLKKVHNPSLLLGSTLGDKAMG